VTLETSALSIASLVVSVVSILFATLSGRISGVSACEAHMKEARSHLLSLREAPKLSSGKLRSALKCLVLLWGTGLGVWYQRTLRIFRGTRGLAVVAALFSIVAWAVVTGFSGYLDDSTEVIRNVGCASLVVLILLVGLLLACAVVCSLLGERWDEMCDRFPDVKVRSVYISLYLMALFSRGVGD
jgi:hypothetical protein